MKAASTTTELQKTKLSLTGQWADVGVTLSTFALVTQDLWLGITHQQSGFHTIASVVTHAAIWAVALKVINKFCSEPDTVTKSEVKATKAEISDAIAVRADEIKELTRMLKAAPEPQRPTFG